MIKSISFKNYRGFKEEQTIHFASKGNFTFLVGANNSGKSLLPRALALIRKIRTVRFAEKEGVALEDKAFHNFEDDASIELSVVFDYKECKTHAEDTGRYSSLKALSNALSACLAFSIKKEEGYNDPLLSINFSFDGKSVVENGIINNSLLEIYGLSEEVAQKIIGHLLDLFDQSVLIFSPIRGFRSEKAEEYFENGINLHHWIAGRQRKAILKRAIEWLNEHLKLLNLPSFNSLQAETNGKLILNFPKHLGLDIEDCGTGFSMVLILLLEIFRQNRNIIVIDEIESHLQPGLIRRLIRLLRDLKNDEQINSIPQIILATHSPVVVQEFGKNDQLFRFQKQSGACRIFQVAPRGDSSSDLRSVANELGVLPGDALLSNSVIWVEGPTEVKWLRTWLKHYLPIYQSKKNIKFNLLEGLHYSILMTGGGLISRYSFQEDEESIEEVEAEDYLKVIRVNPHPYVIIDSGNISAESGKGKRAIRIASELNEQNRLNPILQNRALDKIENLDQVRQVPNFWALKGKELENYCHPQLLKGFIERLSIDHRSNIQGAENMGADQWKVFSEGKGIGALLKERGISNIGTQSGALSVARKNSLANYVVEHFNRSHFETAPEKMIAPQKEMIDDLTNGLDNLLDYLYLVNQ